MKNIAFAKIGKSIKFMKNNFSAIGGDNEPSAALIALANNNPDKTFYIVGRSDFSRLNSNDIVDIFPYGNVVDCFANCKGAINNPNYLIDWFKQNNIKIDFGFMMIGQIGTVTIPDRVKKIKSDDGFASIIDMTRNYATPIINWLNETPELKWIEIVNDPRYTKAQTRDFIASPVKTLSQYDYTYDHNRIKSFEDQTRIVTSHKSSYAGMETLFCINSKRHNDITKISKSGKFAIVLNEGKPSRYDSLKTWVLDNFDDVEIYGKWSDHIMADSRFRGALHIDEVQRKMESIKYTFIIPIAKGWVTSKYIEMINVGCIPLFHPTYDEQKHINVPSILRVKTPSELLENIELLENDENLRISILNELQTNILKDEYYSGSFINNTLMNAAYDCINETYIQCDKSQYKRQEVIRLI